MGAGPLAGCPVPARAAGRYPRRIARAAVLAAAIALMAALPAAAHAQAAPQPDFEAAAPAAPAASAGVRRDRAALKARLGAQAVLDVDRATGTARVLAKLDGTLSGPASGTPHAIALDYVRAHLSELGLTDADLGTLADPQVTELPGGTHEVRWRQQVGGVVSADSELRVNVTGDGRVLDVLGSPAHALAANTTPALDKAAALRAAGGSGPAELAFFHQRLAWHVSYRAAPDAVYDVMVDAATGRVLRRINLVKFAAGDASVWENFPGAALGGAPQTVNLVGRGWLTGGATTLNGPNAHVYSDTNDDNAFTPSEEISGPDFRQTLTSFAGSGCSASALCSWSGAGTSWMTNRAQNGAQAFYFVNRFHDHLAAPPISFTPADGAFDSGSDPVQVNTDDGASTGPDVFHIDNANMETFPDGESPLMQMYLFKPLLGAPFRDINGGDDASVVYHEYTHGLSGRLITDADGVEALNTAQAGAMGEAWSDWYAKDFLVDQFPALDNLAVAGDVDMGAYTDASPHAIRTQGMDCDVNAVSAGCPNGGYTYGDFGSIDADGPEVHADGEIWGETLWDIRSALTSPVAEALITQGMRLAPPEPTFLDARNAILQADQSLFGGAHRATLWDIFAHRGMGFFASTVDSDDTHPHEDSSTPPAPGGPRGTIAGHVTDSLTGAGVPNATASVGGLTTGPDALAAVTDAGGAFSLPNVPQNTYPSFLFQAPGYDPAVAPVAVAGGATTTLDAKLRRDWAALSGGANTDATAASSAEFAGDSCGPNQAVDQRETTGWSTLNNGGSAGKPLILALPQAVEITDVQIDPGPACGDDLTSGTRGYRVDTSTASAAGPWTQATTGAFGSGDQGRMNSVPLAGAAVHGVRFVRLTLLSPFQSTSSFIDLSELAIHGTPTGTPPVPTPTATPTPTPTPAAPSAPVTPRPVPALATPVSAGWKVKGSRITLTRLLVSGAPPGASATLTCKGSRCPLKSKRTGKLAGGRLDVLKALGSKHTFRAGQTLDLLISAPGYHGRLLRFTLHAGKRPKPAVYCVPLGTKTLKRSCG